MQSECCSEPQRLNTWNIRNRKTQNRSGRSGRRNRTDRRPPRSTCHGATRLDIRRLFYQVSYYLREPPDKTNLSQKNPFREATLNRIPDTPKPEYCRFSNYICRQINNFQNSARNTPLHVC